MLKNKKIVISVSIILVILLAILCYFLFFNKPKSNKDDNKKRVIEDLDAIGFDLSHTVTDYGLNQLDVYAKNEKFSTRITNEQLVAMYYYFKYTKNQTEISKEQVDEYFNKVYNVSLTSYPRIVCMSDNKVIAEYDKDKKKYIPADEEHDHDSDYNPPVLTTVYSSTKEKDDYVVVITKLYIPLFGTKDKSGFYSDGKLEHKINELNSYVEADGITNDAEASTYYMKNYAKLSKKSTKYTYTFKKDGKKYYLVKYIVDENGVH